MVEKLYDRIGVSRDIFELKITSQLIGISLVINADDEDECGTKGDTSKDPNGVSKVPQCGGQAKTGAREAPRDGEEERGGGSGAPNNSAPSITSRWTIPGSEQYSIQPIPSKDLFEDQEGFNTVITQVITIDATHLKAKTKGVLLVAVCKDCNEMIYLLAFGFAHSECIESWMWFLNATYMYRVEEFDREMAELKATNRKVYDKLIQVGIEKFSRVRSPRKRIKGMPINALCSDFFTTGWLQHAYAMTVNPVSKPETWDIPDVVHDRIVLPWLKRKQPRRAKKSRTPSVGRNKRYKHVKIVGKRDTIKKMPKTII
ncbi:hypothetical protein Dsin_001963 [Dipteronia sinensis]|uniref:MULE transposase domain-containing protein n=1 Tax=Dipteronia sinensis TaxID=43782 RepID=A0AAE0B6A7_9ROSI|nr:hypothetical protein Dsin_001963 [Dipteronia sinensis]